ncbi:hypothetical protein G6F22_014826 [Rhizopus arrhizus]|nr:hypothetical protein G6F22_014826 [Rhizopus arrhizus]
MPSACSIAELAARSERVRQRATVNILKLAAERQPLRQAAGLHLPRARQLRQVVRGGLSLDGRAGGDDQLLHLAFGQAVLQLLQPQFARADAIERRQPALQHEVDATEPRSVLDGQAVGGRLNHAQLAAFAAAVGAGRAQLGFAEVAALRAVADALHRQRQGLGQALATFALAFEQMVGHALRGLLAHARQHPQCVDQLFKQGCGHGDRLCRVEQARRLCVESSLLD